MGVACNAKLSIFLEKRKCSDHKKPAFLTFDVNLTSPQHLFNNPRPWAAWSWPRGVTGPRVDNVVWAPPCLAGKNESRSDTY